MLEQSGLAVCPLLNETLVQVFRQSPLEKPTDHKGGSETDMFQIEISLSLCFRVIRAIDLAMQSGWVTTGRVNRDLSGFSEAWHEYLRWLKR
tara:strand:- start:90 stop:365 length:276 start_codon:yes stop_codon:yes gene_type:complete